VAFHRRDCGCPNLWMTTHAEIVVRAPNGHLTLLSRAGRPPNCCREAGGVAVEVDEDPIPPSVWSSSSRSLKKVS
jgi:hypothetical protein